MSVNKVQNEDLALNELKDAYVNRQEINNELKQKIKTDIKSDKLTKADEYFLLGFSSFKEDKNDEVAKEYFNLAIKSIDRNTSEFAKVYSYKFLADIMIKENDIDKAIEYTETAFSHMNPRNYNDNSYIISDIFSTISNETNGRNVAIKYIQDLVDNERSLEPETKIYLYRQLSVLYILSTEYAEAIKVSLAISDLSRKVNNKYYVEKSKVDTSVIITELGGYETAIETLNSVNTSNIEDLKLRYDLEVYKLINLSKLENTIGLYDEALKHANEITKYENEISFFKRKDVINMKNIIIADIHISNNNIKLAKEYIQKIDDSFYKEKSIYSGIKAFYSIVLGKISEKEGNINQSIKCFEKAIEYTKEESNVEYHKTSLNYLMKLYEKMDDSSNVLKYSNEMIQLQNAKDDLLSKKYYEYVTYQEEYKKVEEAKNRMETLMFLLFIFVLGLVIILVKVVIYPCLLKNKSKKKVKSYLENNNYILNYQPIVNPKINKIVGYEALLRLKVNGKIIMPNILIKEIEYCNMMGEVSIWILKKLIQDYAKINEVTDRSNDFYLSMNISLKEIEDDNIYNQLKNILKQSNLDKKPICLEITENEKGQDFKKIKSNIRELMDLGVLIAIDDFGVDYSNISSIERFDFNIIKLDKYFMDNIDESIFIQSLMSSIDYLSVKQNISIVVEGVEDIKQKDIIKSMSSDKLYIQGYYYSKPVEIDNVKHININD